MLCLLAPAFDISLVLQGGECSDQLTLICRHSDILSDPNWIHNGTVEGGQLLSSAFPGVMYSFQSKTEHRVTISGVGNVQALDGYIIQCAYSILGNVVKSNAVKYAFSPPGQSWNDDMGQCIVANLYYIRTYVLLIYVTHTHTNTHTYTPTHPPTRTHTHTHTHTRIHTH